MKKYQLFICDSNLSGHYVFYLAAISEGNGHFTVGLWLLFNPCAWRPVTPVRTFHGANT